MSEREQNSERDDNGPDRYAHGTGEESGDTGGDFARPGVEGGGRNVLPETGRAQAGGADRAEGTIGAVGEMDFTGRPAGPGGASGPSDASAAESEGGGPGGGAMSGGGRPTEAGGGG
jgi:hypothetical protein